MFYLPMIGFLITRVLEQDETLVWEFPIWLVAIGRGSLLWKGHSKTLSCSFYCFIRDNPGVVDYDIDVWYALKN